MPVSSPGSPPAQQAAPRRRRKRTQVARACDGCRIRRIKCDNKVPCSHCLDKGKTCSNSGAPPASTLTQAHEHIGMLKQKIQQLEAELEQRSGSGGNLPTPTRSLSSPFQQAYVPTGNDAKYGRAKKNSVGRGVRLCPARSVNDAWFGASSLFSFIQRLSVFLSINLQQTHSTQNLLPISASDNKLLDRPRAGSGEDPVRRLMSSTGEFPTSGVYLSPTQEEYFLDFFWQTYHTSLSPILNEAQFKKHYQSLWMDGGKERKPSALVDIVIAMCMQYVISTLHPDSQGVLVEGKDALVAGRWHYWRGQTLLTYELESPSISTLQCHILCSVYLCGGSFHNMMDTSVTLAVRTAYILGLHADPPPGITDEETEMRRRLWWAVYLMDSKSAMKLGRPFVLHDSSAMPSLPDDSLEAARVSGSTFAPIGGNATWLSFNLYQTTLYIKVRAAYTHFYHTDLQLDNDQNIWDESHALQMGAEVLDSHLPSFQEWTDKVPEALRMKRQNSGKPLSIDGTLPLIEQFAPLWLQRQRVILELTYHHLIINLYRPMISFTARAPPETSAAKVAMRCAAHCIMISKITHQLLTQTSILDGWHEAFHWQWNAAMTLIGYVAAFPHAQLAAEVHAAIDLAIAVFDNFGVRFSVAANAANIVRDLRVKVEFLAKNQAEGEALAASTLLNNPDNPVLNDTSMSAMINGEVIIPESTNDFELNLFDMAVDIDFWSNFDTLWPEIDNLPHDVKAENTNNLENLRAWC
ncbi:hypothetical protein PISL3812_03584 [Talaromyces islandicus]|uniref:Zn(2)-C6 fungal-type domain-containing protein n=1 Tax=Talaromyces islandicus TaxID=28573 RepID=A0A0U1LT57_TALIS|nr:hypothetical protein PISL3812_03584 [Talaromyces islandicus]